MIWDALQPCGLLAIKKHSCINPMKTINSKMSTLANSEDPDEMPHKASGHWQIKMHFLSLVIVLILEIETLM